MLTAVEIENFRGIEARQRVDLAPLALLFGAKSAGKSGILQALLHLHELIERGSADVDRTEGCSVVGDTSGGLTGSEIGGLLRQRESIKRYTAPAAASAAGAGSTSSALPSLQSLVAVAHRCLVDNLEALVAPW